MNVTYTQGADRLLTSTYWDSADHQAGIAHAWVLNHCVWHLFHPRHFGTEKLKPTLTPITKPNRPVGWWCWRLHFPGKGYLYLHQEHIHHEPCPLPPPGTVGRDHRLLLYSTIMLPRASQNTTVYASHPLTVIRAR